MWGVALLTLAAACADEVTVATTSGRVRGAYNRSLGVYQFMGIPFAAPPVGDLRWQPPARFEPPAEPIDARAFESMGPACPQRGLAPAETSEDCLRLAVWSAEVAGDADARTLYGRGEGAARRDRRRGVRESARPG